MELVFEITAELNTTKHGIRNDNSDFLLSFRQTGLQKDKVGLKGHTAES